MSQHIRDLPAVPMPPSYGLASVARLQQSHNDMRKHLINFRKELAKNFDVSLSNALKEMSDFRAKTSMEISQLRQECKNNKQEKLKNACKEFDLKGDSAAQNLEESLSKALKDMSDFRAQTSKEMSELRQECNNNMQKQLKDACKAFDLKGDSAAKEFEESLSKALKDVSDFRAQTSKEMSELRQECNTTFNEIADFREQISKDMSELRGDIAALSAERNYNKQYEIGDAFNGFGALTGTLETKVRQSPEELATLFTTGVAALDKESTEAFAVKHQYGELQLPVDGMPTNLETLQAPSQIEALSVRLAQEPRQTLNERPEQVGAKTAGQSETQEGLAPIMAALAKMSADANTRFDRLYDLETAVVAQLSDLRQQLHGVIEHSTEGLKETAGKCDRQTERLDKIVPTVRRNADEINDLQQTVGRSLHTTYQVHIHVPQRTDAAER